MWGGAAVLRATSSGASLVAGGPARGLTGQGPGPARVGASCLVLWSSRSTIAIRCYCCRLFYQICAVRMWMSTTLTAEEPPLSIRVRS